jgi:hypothetical protein
MYVYMCVYMCVCMYVSITPDGGGWKQSSAVVISRACLYACMYVYICVCVYIYIYIYVCVCVYVRMCLLLVMEEAGSSRRLS